MTLGSAFRQISLCTLMLACAAVSQARAEDGQVVLSVKQRVTMQELAQSVMDPASPRYQQFYSPEEIRAIAAPTDDEYASLKDQLQAEGFQVVGESPTHLWITVKGEKNALAALSRRARAGYQSMDFSPTRMVDQVNGLKPSQKRRPFMKFLDGDDDGDHKFKGNGPDAIRKFYGVDKIYAAGVTGKGQHIAIATYDDLDLTDVNAYYKMNKITPAPKVDKVHFNGTPDQNEGSAMETELDVEFSGAIAPGAQIHVFTSADNSDAGELAMFTAILDDNRAKVANYSWGSCEDVVDPDHAKAMDSVWARGVAQGVNFTIASGDSGSSCHGDGETVADFQASSPYVVSVGGTTLPKTLKGAETAWSDGGGGISTMNALPDYQSRLGKPFLKRSYPDVSFNADPASGQAVYAHNGGTAGSFVVGGTSIAAPQWVGFRALVGEARGGKALGFLNPKLYGLSDQARDGVMNDVTSGSNGAYDAGRGFDAATGLGSMKANELLNLLKAD